MHSTRNLKSVTRTVVGSGCARASFEGHHVNWLDKISEITNTLKPEAYHLNQLKKEFNLLYDSFLRKGEGKGVGGDGGVGCKALASREGGKGTD